MYCLKYCVHLASKSVLGVWTLKLWPGSSCHILRSFDFDSLHRWLRDLPWKSWRPWRWKHHHPLWRPWRQQTPVPRMHHHHQKRLWRHPHQWNLWRHLPLWNLWRWKRVARISIKTCPWMTKSSFGERRMRTMARMLKNLTCLWRSGAKSMEDSKQQWIKIQKPKRQGKMPPTLAEVKVCKGKETGNDCLAHGPFLWKRLSGIHSKCELRAEALYTWASWNIQTATWTIWWHGNRVHGWCWDKFHHLFVYVFVFTVSRALF